MYYSPCNRPETERHIVAARTNDAIRKVSREDGGLLGQRTILPELEFRLLKILKVKVLKTDISWFSAASRDDVLVSSLQSFKGGPGQNVPYELKIYF